VQAAKTVIFNGRLYEYRRNKNIQIPINAVPFIACPLGNPYPVSAISVRTSGLGTPNAILRKWFKMADMVSTIAAGSPTFAREAGMTSNKMAIGT